MRQGLGHTSLCGEVQMLSPFFVPHLSVSDVGILSLVDMLHECAWRPPN